MAHYAKLDKDNIVLEINVIDNDQETSLGEAGIVSWLNANFNNQGVLGGVTWKKTSYNTRKGKHYENDNETESSDQSKALRKNYATIGGTYDATRDAFIDQKPYDSWVLDESTCAWDAPVTYPDDGKDYNWNEETRSWDEIT